MNTNKFDIIFLQFQVNYYIVLCFEFRNKVILLQKAMAIGAAGGSTIISGVAGFYLAFLPSPFKYNF